jgi:hypothetical protein
MSSWPYDTHEHECDDTSVWTLKPQIRLDPPLDPLPQPQNDDDERGERPPPIPW